MTGPLAGLRVVEFAGLGPGPFCGMMLADHGADVIRIDRPRAVGLIGDLGRDVLNRSRRSIAIDLKSAAGVDLARRICADVDGVFEGFRPGVMERLGLGPDVLLGANPRLVFGRMTGWGQDGPNAGAAGHDINYIALSGALHAIGRQGEKPVPPLNLVGDFGGGGLMLAFGMVSAILNARLTGEGQVVDCAMTEGSAVLMAMIYSLRAQGLWRDERGGNLLDGAAPHYDTYETKDGRYIAIGAIEPQFYGALLRRIGLSGDEDAAAQNDPMTWAAQTERMEVLFRSRTREEWCTVLEGSDACFAPVLSLDEAPHHYHNVARSAFVPLDGGFQPAPAPRYSRTRTTSPAPLAVGDDVTSAVLADCGLTLEEIGNARSAGTVA